MEIIISTIIFSVQSIGLMRTKVDDEFEKEANHYNSLKDLRTVVKWQIDFWTAVCDSMSNKKVLHWSYSTSNRNFHSIECILQ